MVSAKDTQKLEERIARLQNDTSFDWARKPVVQKSIAIATALAALATPVGFLYGSITGVAVAAVMFVGYFILRAATRGVAELPNRYLDERELALRNATYVKAYQTAVTLVAALAVVMFIYAISIDIADEKFAIELGFDQIQAVVWLFLGPITVIPTVTLALKGGRK
ncbi:MAG: hypothetical protein RLZZ514_1060 [Actinomycetota bacterium]|jgi:hypothetical protein